MQVVSIPENFWRKSIDTLSILLIDFVFPAYPLYILPSLDSAIIMYTVYLYEGTDF